MGLIREKKYDELVINTFDSRNIMGKAAAQHAKEIISKAIEEKGSANVMFAAAPSQDDFFKHLLKMDIDWTKVVALHMDEYINLPVEAPQRFGNFLKKALFSKITLKQIHYMNKDDSDAAQAALDYAKIINTFIPDLVCVGVGENGHLAFNDPPTANFNDTNSVKIVKLDKGCREQQVNDGCFEKLEQVPTHAVTVTMSGLFSSRQIIGIVPGKLKAKAIRNVAKGEISTACPASGLRLIKNAVLYIDSEAGALI